MAVEQYANLSQTTLNGSITNVAISMVVTSATGFPASSPYVIKIENEIIRVTAGAGTTTWTITRAQEGTTGVAHNSGVIVNHLLTAGSLKLLAPAVVGTAAADAAFTAQVSGDSNPRLKIDADGTIYLGGGSATADSKISRVTPGNVVLSSNASSNSSRLTIESTSAQTSLLDIRVNSDSSSRTVLYGDATKTGLELGPGSGTRDWTLLRTATDTAAIGTNQILDLSVGRLILPVGTTTFTAEGQVRWNTASAATGAYATLFDSVREISTSSRGWAPYALPLHFDLSSAYATALALAANGGSVALPVVVNSHMFAQDVAIRNTDATLARSWVANLYVDRLNNSNTLDRIFTTSTDSFTAAAASVRTTTLTGAPVYLSPGLYWLVIQNTHATNTFGIGTTAVGSGIMGSTSQTKTTTNPNGATLDFVAATWSKQTAVVAARISGRVFGQTSSF